MILIKYENYFYDCYRKHYEKIFSSLSELKKWVFDSQISKKWDNRRAFIFPNDNYPTMTIEVNRDKACGDIWIHEIFKDGRIVFSDGKYTSGQKHISKELLAWCKECEEYRCKPKFDFED